MAMPSIGDLIAAKVGSHYASMQDQQADFAEKARLRQLEQTIRDSAANAPQQTQFAEPQAQQPATLSGLMQGYQMQANPNVTPITQSAVSPERAVFETLRRQDPMKAQEYASKVITNAHNIAVTGDHAGAVDYVNNSLGTSLKYMGTKDNYMTIDNGDGTKTLYDLESKQSTTFGTPKPTIVNEGAAISDGKGGWNVPAPKAEKIDKGFDTVDLGDKVKIVPRDGSAPYYEKKAAKPDTVIKLDRGAGGKQTKPLPVGALKMQQEGVDAIGTASGIRADLGELRMQVETGALDLGPMKNLWNKGRNWVGWSSPQSRNLQSFTATLQKLRNDSLRLNKGVQTDGDAQRAWAELIDNINDPAAVSQRLQEIDAINERAVALHEANIDNVRNNYGLEPLDTTPQTNVKSALSKKGAPKGPSQVVTKGGFKVTRVP